MRKKDGTFDKGNPGGPGRPKRETERAYLDAMIAECSPETWRKISRKAVEDAVDGDSKAREWLSHYVVGKPQQSAPTLKEMAIDEAAGVDEISSNDIFLAGSYK